MHGIYSFPSTFANYLQPLSLPLSFLFFPPIKYVLGTVLDAKGNKIFSITVRGKK